MRTADSQRRIVRRWTVAAIGVILVATLAVAATYTPLFAAKDIRLRGSGRISRATILSVARVDDRSNVFHLDVGDVERRLERDPRIFDAQVTTSLPGTLTISVVSRTPVGVVGTDATGSHRDLVGADGVVIGPAGHPVDLPALVGANGGRPVGPRALATAAAAAGALDPALRRAVDAVVVTRGGGLEVRLAAGFSASLGDASELAAKAESLAALLAWVQDRDIRVVSADVSVPGSPTAKLERGSTAVPVP